MMMDLMATFTGGAVGAGVPPDAQALGTVAGGAGAVTGASTNVYTRGVATDLGSGQPLFLVVAVGGKVGTTPTLRAQLIGADEITFTTGRVVVADTGTWTDPASPGFLRAGIAAHVPKMFFRLEFATGGAGVGFNVVGGLVLDAQTTPLSLQ